MDKLERLKNVKSEIENFSSREHGFDRIKKLLLEELNTEERENGKTSYYSSLKNVKEYELFKYESSKKRRPSKSALSDYQELTRRFKLIVDYEIRSVQNENGLNYEDEL